MLGLHSVNELTALIKLFLLCLVRFSGKRPRDVPTAQHWFPASETQASPERVAGAGWGTQLHRVVVLGHTMWRTAQGAKINPENIRSAGVLLLWYLFFFFSVTFKWSQTFTRSSILNSYSKPQKSIWKQDESARRFQSTWTRSPWVRRDFSVLAL